MSFNVESYIEQNSVKILLNFNIVLQNIMKYCPDIDRIHTHHTYTHINIEFWEK
jgi:hypothetical protein